MAQGAVASLMVNGTMLLTADEIHEILECEKIIRFRDVILSGDHPRIKVPPHLSGKSTAHHASSPSSLTPRPNPSASQDGPTTNKDVTNIEGTHSGYSTEPSNAQHPPGRTTTIIPMAVKAEIHPIFLEKSDGLIKAEIQLLRQRAERALGEQVSQRRLSQKAALQTSESLPDFDISDVLSKALSIVHPSTTTETEQTVGDHASASDSFDENTFYSSQHDTPEHSSASHENRQLTDVSVHDVALATLPASKHFTNRAGDEPGDLVVSDVSLSMMVDPAVNEPHHKPSPSVQLSSQRLSQNRLAISLNDANSTSGDQPNIEYGEDAGGSKNRYKPSPDIIANPLLDRMTSVSSHPPKQIADWANVQSRPHSELNYGELAPSTYDEILEPVIIRTRDDDVPTLAPQPARVSPLATARAPPILGQSMIVENGTPVQAVAVRKSAGSSQDSSLKGIKPADKKKNKKSKKRKSSGKQPAMIDTPESPYIKPEPQSPSTIFAAPLPRPLKRQRQTLEAGSGLNYDDPSYDVTREDAREQVLPPRYKDHGPRRMYDRVENERPYEQHEIEPYAVRRRGRDERQHQRLVGHEEYREPPIYREPVSPSMHTLPFTSNQPRGIRAVSHAVTERRVQEPLRYYADLPPRAGVRIDADRDRSRSPVMHDRSSPVMMAPPRLPPTYVLVDEYGNQWTVPMAPRPSASQITRPSEDNRTYEGPPPRPVARAPIDIYEDDGLVYRKPTPSLSTMRRVITQPDHDIEYRSYRQRDYSMRPETRVLPSKEYVRVREPVERRQMSHMEETSREYARLGSVRPESVRYAAPREYAKRVQSVHPEALPRVHASSVRPEPRRELATQPFREFSVRPNDSEAIRREFIPRGTSYAPSRPITHHVDEADYVEKQGGAPEDLYMEDVRPQILYR